MADILYLSRGLEGHNARWIRTLTEGGHRVTAETVDSVEALRSSVVDGPVDLIVAGPLTDATIIATEADIAPVFAICWGFDLLVEMYAEGKVPQVSAALRMAVGVHVDCQSLADEVVRLGARPDRVSIGAWGIDTDVFSPGPPRRDVRGDIGWGASEKVILTNRTWAALYHVDIVLRGFALAHEVDASLRLAWAGGGPQAAELRALASELGIEQAVAELGNLDSATMLDWLRSADLYVSASTSDGSSLSLMEALAVGLPAVVTDLPGNREWVLDEEFGTLFPTGSAEGLARAIGSALLRPSTEVLRGRRRELVTDKGDWRKNRAIFLDAVERSMR